MIQLNPLLLNQLLQHLKVSRNQVQESGAVEALKRTTNQL